MKYALLVLISILVTYLYQGGAQTPGGSCPGGVGTCNCQLNNVEALRSLIRTEVEAQVEAQVEAEVASRLAATPGIDKYSYNIIIIISL